LMVAKNHRYLYHYLKYQSKLEHLHLLMQNLDLLLVGN